EDERTLGLVDQTRCPAERWKGLAEQRLEIDPQAGDEVGAQLAAKFLDLALAVDLDTAGFRVEYPNLAGAIRQILLDFAVDLFRGVRRRDDFNSQHRGALKVLRPSLVRVSDADVGHKPRPRAQLIARFVINLAQPSRRTCFL